MTRAASKATALVVVAAGLAGCDMRPPDGWSTQLAAEGPCWRVDLLDGLDESSTAELQDLYACVNREGAVEPLRGLVEALEQPGRAGVALGLELARLVNDLPQVDVDPWALAEAGLALLEDEEQPLAGLGELAVELLYARPYGEVSTTVVLADPAALGEGVLLPLLPVLQEAATTVLDDGEAMPALLAQVATDPALADLACTVAGLATSTDPSVQQLSDGLVADLGDALRRAGDSTNDRWADASGNSLRDLARALLVPDADGRSLLSASREALLPILDDAQVLANLRQTLDAARLDGRLAPLPAQLEHLARVDVDGGTLAAGEDSALHALLRLLDAGNTELTCSVDLVVTTLDIELGNLSVAILAALADQDPDAVADGLGLLSTVLGWGLTEATLDLIADSGVCPGVDAQLVSDLGALDRLDDPAVGDLLVVLLEVLDDVQEGEQDHLVDVVDVLSIVVDRGAVPPLEEALLDLGSAAFSARLVQVVGLVLDPATLQVDACPTDSAALDLEGLVGLLRAAVTDRGGGAPIDVVDPLLQVLIEAPGTWEALDHLATLAQAPDARLHQLLPLLSALMSVDPDLELVGDLGAILGEPALTGPLLRIAEAEAVVTAASASAVDQEGPLPFMARLVVDGTLDSVLRTVDLVVDMLAGAQAASAPAPTPPED